MKNKKSNKKFETAFTGTELSGLLSGLTPNQAYAFTKKDEPLLFNQVLNLLPTGYSTSKAAELESVDFVYSGSTQSQFLLTIAAGRSDRFKGKECFDIDVFNIAPESGSTDSYFLNQWHHFKDAKGNRTSFDVNPFYISDGQARKDALYSTFLTGSTSYYSFEDYAGEKPDFYEMHVKSFGDLDKT